MKTLTSIMLVMVFGTTTVFGATGVTEKGMEWPKETTLAENYITGDRIVVEFTDSRDAIGIRHCLEDQKTKYCAIVGPSEFYKITALKDQRDVESVKSKITAGTATLGAAAAAVGVFIFITTPITSPIILVMSGVASPVVLGAFLASPGARDPYSYYGVGATLDDLIDLNAVHGSVKELTLSHGHGPGAKLAPAEFKQYLDDLNKGLADSDSGDNSDYKPDDNLYYPPSYRH